MSREEKLIQQILSGRSDENIVFNDLRKILSMFGFKERIKGDHFIYAKTGVEEIMNIQPLGDKAKPYQVKQVRGIIIKYKL